MDHSLQKHFTSALRLTMVTGLCVAITACVVPPHANYGYGNPYPRYASGGLLVQPRPISAPPPQVYVQPRPHEGGWGWNTPQRDRMERRFDGQRRVF
jgi:hypothetical protein